MTKGRKQIRASEIESLKKKLKSDKAAPVESAPIPALPTEILTEVINFLGPKDLARLKQVNRLFKDIVDTHYQAYSKLYHRLHKIEPSLAPELPAINFLKAYHETLKKVKALQQDEIQFLTENHALPVNTFAIQNENLTELQRLEQQSQKLDEVNSNIIKQHINLNSTILDLPRKKITRLPKQLFDANEYVNYWKNLVEMNLFCNRIRTLPLTIDKCQALQSLSCNENQLTSLPETLGNCQALQSLYCVENQLTFLPATLGNCQALQSLYCGKNQLTFLPATLGNCQALQSLYCRHNQLTFLPATLGNCQALQWLDCVRNQLTFLPATLGNCQALEELICVHNQLTSIPATLGNCQALQYLYCDRNQLTSLPDNLVTKFGAHWARAILNNQQPIVHNAPAITSVQTLQVPNTLTPAHNSIKRRKNDISACEMQQLDESAIMQRGAKRTRVTSKIGIN